MPQARCAPYVLGAQRPQLWCGACDLSVARTPSKLPGYTRIFDNRIFLFFVTSS
jgi:hypothetical protein